MKSSERELLLKKEKLNLELQRARALAKYWERKYERLQGETAMNDPNSNNSIEYRSKQ